MTRGILLATVLAAAPTLPPLAVGRAEPREARTGAGGASAPSSAGAFASTPPTPDRTFGSTRPSPPQAGGGRGGGIPSPTGKPGDPARGRVIVADRTRGLCLLCHSAPIPEERFQGDLAPSLAGAGARSSEAELRLRLVDGRRLNPDTIMPSYGRTSALDRVGAPFRGTPILTPEEIEDVVAWLATLKEPP